MRLRYKMLLAMLAALLITSELLTVHSARPPPQLAKLLRTRQLFTVQAKAPPPYAAGELFESTEKRVNFGMTDLNAFSQRLRPSLLTGQELRVNDAGTVGQ